MSCPLVVECISSPKGSVDYHLHVLTILSEKYYRYRTQVWTVIRILHFVLHQSEYTPSRGSNKDFRVQF